MKKMKDDSWLYKHKHITLHSTILFTFWVSVAVAVAFGLKKNMANFALTVNFDYVFQYCDAL